MKERQGSRSNLAKNPGTIQELHELQRENIEAKMQAVEAQAEQERLLEEACVERK